MSYVGHEHKTFYRYYPMTVLNPCDGDICHSARHANHSATQLGLLESLPEENLTSLYQLHISIEMSCVGERLHHILERLYKKFPASL